MADTMQFDLVSPERKLASVEASQVQIPGMEGDLTAMPEHAPFLTTLRPGLVRVTSGGNVTEYVVTGGFAEVSPAATTVLAEQAMLRSDATSEMAAELEAEAETARAEAPEPERRAADQRLRDVKMMRAQLSI